MVIVKGSIEFTKLLIKIILEERKSCKGRSLQLVGKYYFFVKKKKGNPQMLKYIHRICLHVLFGLYWKVTYIS